MLNHIYKEVPKTNGRYLVSPKGEISNRFKILKTFINNSGYECLIIHVDKKRKHILIHRVVAKVFVLNKENKREVNHLDGNKLNNNANNLEWCTSSENKKHALKTGLKIYNKPTLGIKKGKTSKYNNVSFDQSRNRWIGAIRDKGKTHYQKRFKTEEEAALHVNWVIDKLNLTDRPKNVVNM